MSILHALSEIFRCVAAGDTLKFYLLISNFYLLDVAVRPHHRRSSSQALRRVIPCLKGSVVGADLPRAGGDLGQHAAIYRLHDDDLLAVLANDLITLR